MKTQLIYLDLLASRYWGARGKDSYLTDVLIFL